MASRVESFASDCIIMKGIANKRANRFAIPFITRKMRFFYDQAQTKVKKANWQRHGVHFAVINHDFGLNKTT